MREWNQREIYCENYDGHHGSYGSFVTHSDVIQILEVSFKELCEQPNELNLGKWLATGTK